MIGVCNCSKCVLCAAVTHAAKPIGVPRIGGPFELIDCKTGMRAAVPSRKAVLLVLFPHHPPAISFTRQDCDRQGFPRQMAVDIFWLHFLPGCVPGRAKQGILKSPVLYPPPRLGHRLLTAGAAPFPVQITDVMTRLEATRVTKDKVIPVFITIDPKRDSVEVVREYVQGMHPRPDPRQCAWSAASVGNL